MILVTPPSPARARNLNYNLVIAVIPEASQKCSSASKPYLVWSSSVAPGTRSIETIFAAVGFIVPQMIQGHSHHTLQEPLTGRSLTNSFFSVAFVWLLYFPEKSIPVISDRMESMEFLLL